MEEFPAMRLLLQPEWLIDGTGSDAREGEAIVVDNGVIEAVGPVRELENLPGLTAIRLEHASLLPGLMNNHVHLNLPGDNTPMVPWLDTQTDASLALRSAENARRSLAAGITTVRDCGGRGTTVLDTRDAMRAGLADGATIVSCGWPITITGGHTRHMGGEVDGADGVRQMVRRLVSLGADFIKLMASGGGTPGSLPQRPSFTVEELTVIVETAHDLGRKVSMHCIATESIDRAITAGADLIEHAMFYGLDVVPRLDERVAQRLADSQIPVTPTTQVAKDILDLRSPADDMAVWAERRAAALEIVARLREMGVPMLAGSDAGWRATAFETFWRELAELVEAGMSPVAAIAAATSGPANALGLDHVGTLHPGLRADLLVVEGNVATDIRCLARVKAVFQGGRQVVPTGPLAVA
jgi:imidazolonepropionase-like amidohydrolase